MNAIAALGGTALFFGGAAAALLASYPIPENNLYVCFIAVLVGLASSILAVAALVLHATGSVNATTKVERVRVDRVVEATVDQLLKRRGLELVDTD